MDNTITPEKHVAMHMENVTEHIVPALRRAFERGSEKYKGYSHHWDGKALEARDAEKDIYHVRECHVDVRLAEAEDAATCDDLDTALAKIESALGYLCVLHFRTRLRKTGEKPGIPLD